MQSYNFHPLFEDVQMQRVFPDGKTFVDCVPRNDLAQISAAYETARREKDFDLKTFVLNNFEPPKAFGGHYTADRQKTVEQHIEVLWDVLTRMPEKEEKGSLIPLPYPYIVPGGRFAEIYYWDSYFTMLGLSVSGREDMIENMVKNFSFLIDTLGYIPNGNRTYYTGRSQPPFYSLMLKLLAEKKGKSVLTDHLTSLEKEYRYWMKGKEDLSVGKKEINQVVLLDDGVVMNRYRDEQEGPRPESYREDVELAHGVTEKNDMYRHLRAGAASGWDFSSRWFSNPQQFETIHTTDFVPVDLNCLLYQHELTLAEAHQLAGNTKEAAWYTGEAEKRKDALLKYCWDPDKAFFVDFDFAAGGYSSRLTLAGCFPLYFNIADAEQAAAVKESIESSFLQKGGLITTLETTAQQWDAPNGWAPLQWMAVSGLENYGFDILSAEIARRWILLNDDVYKRTGKLMEKYNVVDTHLEAGGGEYPGQDGFGWTNGVLLALINKYGKS